MIGDLYLFIMTLWKQNFCTHDYKHTALMQHSMKTCKKCGRIK